MGKRTTTAPKPLAKRVRAIMLRNVEPKGFQNTLVGTWGSVGTTWIEADVSSMSQGDTLANRDGRKIAISGFEFRGILAQGSNEVAIDDAYNCFRIVLGLYQGIGGITPLASAGTTLNTSISKDSGTRGTLLRKLYDKYIALNVQATEQGAGDGYAPQVRTVNYYKKFKTPITVTYGDDTVNQPDKRLVLSMISDSGAAINPGFVCGYYRIYAKDV